MSPRRRGDACRNGHPYPENAVLRTNGNLAYCRACNREARRRYDQRHREAIRTRQPTPEQVDHRARTIIKQTTYLERYRTMDGYRAPEEPVDLDLLEERIGCGGGSHWDAADWVDYHDYAGRIPAADGPSKASDIAWLKLLELDEDAWRYITTEEQLAEALEVFR